MIGRSINMAKVQSSKGARHDQNDQDPDSISRPPRPSVSRPWPPRSRRRPRGGALAAGILGGLAAGAIIGAAVNGPYYGYGPGYYYGPGPVYYDGPPCYISHRRYLGRPGLACATRSGLRLGGEPKSR